jgi:alpha-ketoglutarate-dependent taurine dioxygenase
VLLSRYSRQDDIIVAAPTANRNSLELEKLIGFFANTLVIRTILSGDPTFAELVARVRESLLGAHAHQDLPFEKLVEILRPERNLSYAPIAQVAFHVQHLSNVAPAMGRLALSPMSIDSATTKRDLAVFIDDTQQGLFINWEYNTDIFEAGTIEKMAKRFGALVESIASSPETRISGLEMLNEEERMELSMVEKNREQNKLNRFKSVRVKAVGLPEGDLVNMGFIVPGSELPLMIQPAADEVDLVDWAKSNRRLIETRLMKHGAVLFRGFPIRTISDFEQFASLACDELFGEYGDLPREQMSGKVYGSTPYPSDQIIMFHNEASHTRRWPMKIMFYCVKAAEQGGETPIVDSRNIYDRLDPQIRDEFARRKLMYVRNFTDGLDVSWQSFFRTEDKSAVEARCREAKIDFQWKVGNGLRIRQICQAVASHPRTNEMVFFNQIQLHHVSCLDHSVRKALSALFEEEDYPRNVYFGDGLKIEDHIVEELRELYTQESVSFRWQEGDIMMLDNMLVAHGRNVFTGSRKIVVAIGDLMSADQLE